jgi:hypothetical protein
MSNGHHNGMLHKRTGMVDGFISNWSMSKSNSSSGSPPNVWEIAFAVDTISCMAFSRSTSFSSSSWLTSDTIKPMTTPSRSVQSDLIDSGGAPLFLSR